MQIHAISFCEFWTTQLYQMARKIYKRSVRLIRFVLPITQNDAELSGTEILQQTLTF